MAYIMLVNSAILAAAGLPLGGTAGYISFNSQIVAMVNTPTGEPPTHTSTHKVLTGDEVRTVLIIDTQLTSNLPVEVFAANDTGRAH